MAARRLATPGNASAAANPVGGANVVRYRPYSSLYRSVYDASRTKGADSGAQVQSLREASQRGNRRRVLLDVRVGREEPPGPARSAQGG